MWRRCVARLASCCTYFLPTLVLVTAFVTAPAAAQSAAPAPNPALDINKKAQELNVAINALKPGDVIKVSQREMADLATAISKSADSKAAATAWAKALTALWIDKTPARAIDQSNEDLRKTHRKLSEAFTKFKQKGPAAPAPSVTDINAQAALLASGLERLKPTEADANKDRAIAQLMQLAA